MLPALFVSHGAPTMPFEAIPAREFLKGLGMALARPRGIVIATAHWETDAPAVAKVPVNGTIHDFYGFPQTLYDLRYPAPGDAALSDRVAQRTGASLDTARGLDHGAWVPLLLMYPEHDIPVVQIAVQPHLGVAHHIALGRALAPLREEDILVMGSGSFVHNLRRLDRRGPDAPEPDWSRAFSDWMDDAIIRRDDDALIHYRARAPFAVEAHPEDEHLLPLFVAYGAGGAASRLHSSHTYGSLRLDAYGFA
jgi:4,5-DOPA dioxygenase extradiol